MGRPMKTTSFSEVSVRYPKDTPDIEIGMKVPGEEQLTVTMSPEELLMFIVELGNGLRASRKVELLELQRYNLRMEQRKGKGKL